MKTIFIPIQNRLQARNILRTDVLKTLLSDIETRVVLFAPIFKVDEYKKEFVADNLIIEGIKEMNSFLSRTDLTFNRLSLFYLDNPNARFLRKQWLFFERKKPIKYFISISLLLIFGNIKILRKINRFLDFKLVKDDHLDGFFVKYKPDLVFSPNIISNMDRSFLRHAKKRNVKTVGMINAWDNITLSKYPFRILPDKLIVHNEITKGESVKYLDMKEEDVFISGMPHFDHYVRSERVSRNEFCKKLNINPIKKIILFASIGSTLNPTELQVLSLLDKAFIEKKLSKDIVIIFRQHPTEKNVLEEMNFSNNIVFDDSKTSLKLNKEKKYSEILKDDMNHLADSIYHSEVTINTASTMSIDASVFNKPIINIAFDGWEKRHFHESVLRFYRPNHVHYQPIVKSGGVKIVYSIDELIHSINSYLDNPGLDRDGRKRIIEEHCFKLDGKSGQRIGKFISGLA